MKRPTLKKTVSLALACVLSLSLLAGCGSSGSGDNSDKTVMTIGISADLSSLDPHLQNDTSSGYATRHIYSTLVLLDETTNEFVGDLAESWEAVDDVTYNFKLKEGVTFHNGDTLTSEDVKFSLERQKESAKVGHLVSMIESVEVVDDLNFIIHLNSPSNALISSLAHMGSAILDKTYTEELEASGKTLADAPMGTGQYTFKEWVPGASFELTKYDNYFDPERAAQNDGLIFKIIPEETSRTIALENGEIDVMLNVPANDADRIRESESLALDEFGSTRSEFLLFNVTKAPFDNVKVRQAMNYAINKDDVLTAMVNGAGKTTNEYFNSAAIGYEEVDGIYTYDPAKAKELLAEAGYGDGFTFTCYLAGDARNRAATVIQANLQEIGVTMNIEMMESATFYERTGKGEHQAAISGWIANAEPDNTYRPLFTSYSVGDGGNRSFYSNPEVDALVDDAAVNPDPAAVSADHKQILEILVNDAIWVPLNEWTGMVARQANLQGIGLSAIGMERFEGLHY